MPIPPLLRSVVAVALLAASLLAQRGQVETRSYRFEKADRDVEYALFVPKGIDRDKPLPLVVLLHGLGSTPQQVIRYQGITDEAQKRGYVVVAPFGLNERGWYGSRGKGKAGAMFGNASDPDNLGELSELDVFNVLDIVQKELRIDRDRVYLMGHSMGGAGTIHLASTRPELWAAVAPLSPALDRKTDRLDAMKQIPVFLASGDKDNLVPVATVRAWAKAMEARKMDVSYHEIEGGDHVRAIARNAALIGEAFDFFDARRRGKRTAGEAGATGGAKGDDGEKAGANDKPGDKSGGGAKGGERPGGKLPLAAR